MKVQTSPMRYQWFSLSKLKFENEKKMVLKKASPPTIIVMLVPFALGIFLIDTVIDDTWPDPKLVGYLFSAMFIFVSYMAVHVFFFDTTTFDGIQERLLFKRGIFSGSIKKNIDFSDIKAFQVIEYISMFDDNYSKTKTYQLNIVFNNNERVHLITSYSKDSIVGDAKKVATFTKRPIKVERVGETNAY